MVRIVANPRSIPAFLFGLCFVACGERKPPADAGEPAPRPVAIETDSPADPADLAPCPPGTGMISDGETGPNRTNPLEGRGGYWYTYTDDKGSEVTPISGDKGGTFTMTAGGANGTAHAARMTGKLGTAQIIYAGMGLGFIDPKGEYDARKYKGISFWAKKGSPDSTRNVRVKLPDHNTDPAGKVCTECYNDFGAYLEFTDEWKQYFVSFAAMKQQADWGKPRPPH
ncbi:MAG TPA: hypothetical protein VF103_08445, partial [Polyangiaceae bacterium]